MAEIYQVFFGSPISTPYNGKNAPKFQELCRIFAQCQFKVLVPSQAASSLSRRSVTCFGDSSRSKECPEAKSSNVVLFDSPAAGALTNREGKCPKGALFHRTDEGAPGREAARRRLALRNQTRWVPGIGFQRRNECAPGLTQ